MSVDPQALGLAAKALAQTASLPALYLGQVATRCYQPNNHLGASAGQWQMTRSVHWARDTILSPTVVFPNWYTSTQSENAAGPGTIKASIEYPVGVYTLADQCIAAGNAAVTFSTGNTTLTFSGVSIPRGKQFFVRVLIQSSNIIPYYQHQSAYCADAGEGWMQGTGTVSDYTTSGTFSSNVIMYCPLVIASTTRNPSVLILGDSREEGGTEGITDQTSDVGPIARSVGPMFGYSSFASSGTTQANYNAATRTYRDALVALGYWSHIVNSYGVNDISAATTPAALAALRATCAALYPGVTTIGCTLEPHDSTTDGWATLANQNGYTGNAAQMTAFNHLVRASISGEAFYWDLSDLIDPNRRGIWPVDAALSDNARANVAQFTGSISGTTLTVTAIASGTLRPLDPITDNLTTLGNVAPGTYIVSQLTGTTGSTGTYQLNKTHSGFPYPNAVASTTLYTAAWATNDGLHQTNQLSQVIRDRGGPLLRSLIRR